jgi:hypothetical protein
VSTVGIYGLKEEGNTYLLDIQRRLDAGVFGEIPLERA